MPIDEVINSDKTKEAPPTEEKEREINEDEVGFGVDEKGFWHFMCHSKKGVHSVLGFLEMSKDAVKAHYIGQLRAEAAEKQRKGLLRPDNISSIVNKVKGRFKR